MGCLLIFISIVLFLVFPPLGILMFLVSIVVMLMESNRSNAQVAQTAREMKRIALLSAPPEVQAAEAERERQQAAANRKTKIIAAGVIGALMFLAWIGGMSGGKHSSSDSTPQPTATPYVQPTPYGDTETVATPTPEPTVERATLVTPAPSPTPDSTWIPEPTEEQATAAFNDLQDQFGRPHVKSVVYDAKTDCYVWIGPKSGKKMSMRRTQFEAEIWAGYYKAHR